MTSALRWDEIPTDTPLGRLTAPFRGIDEGELALDNHLVGNGTIQLMNPGFDEYLIGPGAIPWYGYGHCALLAWHLHLHSGWPLVTLGPGVSAPMVHTAVQAPDGRIVDWRGALDPAEAVEEYVRWLYTPSQTEPERATWRWQPNDPDEWAERWLLGKSVYGHEPTALIEMGGWDLTWELGGRTHRVSPYDEFEITLTDHVARLIVRQAEAATVEALRV